MLNQKQQEAVDYIEGPLLILAGAGAGKTKTITERIINIIKKGTEPHRILALTFTNKAANEMKERILKRLNEEGVFLLYDSSPLIKTFHSFGLWFLKREYKEIGLQKNFTILDSEDSKSIIKNILENLGVDTKIYEPNKIKNLISREKNSFTSYEEYKEKIYNYTTELVYNVWQKYDAELKSQEALDFDDLILKCMHILNQNQKIKEKYQNYFEYINIDEYQDTNDVQYKLIKLLVNPIKNNICVVGDVDQNIYSWRGANLKNIMNFEKDFPNTKTILLEQNYRSTQNILNLANRSIQKNTIRKEKNLYTQNGPGEKIEVLPAFDEESEAQWVSIKCKELILSGVDPNQIAILYRTNFQSRVLEEMMLYNDVPYIVLGTKFFERKEIKDILAYLRASLNPSSQIDLKRVFETPKKGIGKSTILKFFAKEKLNTSAENKIQNVFNFLNKIKDKLQTETLSSVLNFILVESGIEKELKEDGEDGAIRLGNILELIALAQKFDDLKYDENIEKFFEIASLSSEQDEDQKEKTGVRLMTVHASKGLEFDYVFIVGLEDDLFPSKNYSGKQKTKEEEEEERRLFYVAVTRAKKKLFLTYAEMRTIFGQKNISAPSEFLEDLEMTNCDYHDIYYKQKQDKIFYI